MGVMKRDVNLGLLLLIVAALIMFSGFTVYYQTTFKNVSRSYETKLNELESISKELESKRGLTKQARSSSSGSSRRRASARSLLIQNPRGTSLKVTRKSLSWN